MLAEATYSQMIEHNNQFYNARQREGCLVIRLSEFVDSLNFEEVVNDLIHYLDQRLPCRVILDMQNIEMLQSVAIGRLVQLHRHISDAEGVLRLCCVSEMVRNVLAITHIITILDVCDTEEEALHNWTPAAKVPSKPPARSATFDRRSVDAVARQTPAEPTIVKKKSDSPVTDTVSDRPPRDRRVGKTKPANKKSSKREIMPAVATPTVEEAVAVPVVGDNLVIEALEEAASTVTETPEVEHAAVAIKEKPAVVEKKRPQRVSGSQDGLVTTLVNIIMFFVLSKWTLGLLGLVGLYFVGNFVLSGPHVSVVQGRRVAQQILDDAKELRLNGATEEAWGQFRHEVGSRIDPLILELSKMGASRTKAHDLLLDSLKMVPDLLDETQAAKNPNDLGDIQNTYRNNLKAMDSGA